MNLILFLIIEQLNLLVDNGLTAYFDWHDDMSWHPNGRNVSATSQVMLHVTAATLYPNFWWRN